MLLDLLLIATCVTIIVDISGIIDTVKYFIGKMFNIKNYLYIRLMPFDCSFCMNFWVVLIYICIFEFTLLNLFYILILSCFTSVIKDLILSVKDIFTKILEMTQWL